MIADMQKIINYFTELGSSTLTKENMDWLQTKLESIKNHIEFLDKKVFEAETREKLGTERQKTFGEAQTRVETERHKNIQEEIKQLKEAGITQYNRSSYPMFPRHKIQGKDRSFKPREKGKTAEHINRGEKGQ